MFSKISSRKTTIGFFLTVLFSIFLTTALWAQNNTAVELPPVDNASKLTTAVSGNQTPLDKTIADFQKVWLNIDGQTELAFYLNETSGKANGGVLLIPNLNQHPASYGLINNLRHSLSANHWHTLAVNMTGADTLQAMKIIDAGIAYLHSQDVYNIALLGEGTGAAQALQYSASLPAVDAANNNSNKIRALLLINANNHLPDSGSTNDNDTLEALSKIKLPVFDAYSSSDYLQKQRAEERKQTAQRQIKTLYQQARLPQVAEFQQHGENRITKRIRGWLDKNMAGFMADK